jgi:hypothetical protein
VHLRNGACHTVGVPMRHATGHRKAMHARDALFRTRHTARVTMSAVVNTVSRAHRRTPRPGVRSPSARSAHRACGARCRSALRDVGRHAMSSSDDCHADAPSACRSRIAPPPHDDPARRSIGGAMSSWQSGICRCAPDRVNGVPGAVTSRRP